MKCLFCAMFSLMNSKPVKSRPCFLTPFHNGSGMTPATRKRHAPCVGGGFGVQSPSKWTLTPTPEAGGDVLNPGPCRLAQVCPGPRRGGARGLGVPSRGSSPGPGCGLTGHTQWLTQTVGFQRRMTGAPRKEEGPRPQAGVPRHQGGWGPEDALVWGLALCSWMLPGSPCASQAWAQRSGPAGRPIVPAPRRPACALPSLPAPRPPPPRRWGAPEPRPL